MRMTFHTDYALRMLIYLALSSDGRATVGQIAKAYDLSRHHLLKVAQTLRAQGLIETIRGRTGGIRLASSPAQINVGAVVRAVEEEMVVVECMGSGRCQISPACRLKGVFAEALSSFMDILDRYSLADVVGNRGDLIPLLGLDGGNKVQTRKVAVE